MRRDVCLVGIGQVCYNIVIFYDVLCWYDIWSAMSRTNVEVVLFVAFVAVNTNIRIFCDEAPCSLVDWFQCFGGTFCLHLQGILIRQFFLRNARTSIPNKTASHPRRPHLSPFIYPHEGATGCLWNISTFLPDCTTSRHKTAICITYIDCGMFGNRVLWRMYGPKRTGGIGRWIKLRHEEFNNLLLARQTCLLLYCLSTGAPGASPSSKRCLCRLTRGTRQSRMACCVGCDAGCGMSHYFRLH